MNISFGRKRGINVLAAFALLALCLTQLASRAEGQPGTGLGVGKVSMNDFNFGIVPGEMARITVANTNDSAPPGATGPIRARLTLFNAEGVVIHTSPEVVIPSGQFRSIDVEREQLSDRGDYPTGRVQLLGRVIVSAGDGSRVSDGTSNTIFFSEAPLSLEVVKTSTGATTLGHTIGLRHEHTRPE